MFSGRYNYPSFMRSGLESDLVGRWLAGRITLTDCGSLQYSLAVAVDRAGSVWINNN
jgi:hypothetical protein